LAIPLRDLKGQGSFFALGLRIDRVPARLAVSRPVLAELVLVLAHALADLVAAAGVARPDVASRIPVSPARSAHPAERQPVVARRKGEAVPLRDSKRQRGFFALGLRLNRVPARRAVSRPVLAELVLVLDFATLAPRKAVQLPNDLAASPRARAQLMVTADDVSLAVHRESPHLGCRVARVGDASRASGLRDDHLLGPILPVIRVPCARIICTAISVRRARGVSAAWGQRRGSF